MKSLNFFGEQIPKTLKFKDLNTIFQKSYVFYALFHQQDMHAQAEKQIITEKT